MSPPRRSMRFRIPSFSKLLFFLGISLAIATVAAASDGPPTAIHKAGHCAMRGQDKKSFFGGQLPKPYNGPAKEPDNAVRKQLVELCGAEWSEGPVCCDGDQISNLATNLKRAEALIASCPACKANFFNLFCSFTCSPDQSLFLNITETEESSKGVALVSEIDYFLSPTYTEGFYDSCKDLKFSATNGRVMDLIGGGAKNPQDFLAFLGKKNPPFGSPFQINFPTKDKLGDKMKPMHDKPKKCNDEDVAYRCACMDCPAVCPILPEPDETKVCKVGAMPCWSFAVTLIYCLSVAVLASVLTYKQCMKYREKRRDNLRLLRDSDPDYSDDDDDIVLGAGIAPERHRKRYALDEFLDRMFYRIGETSAKFPAATIGISILIVGIMSLGWLNFSVETDPVRLWVSPTSDAAMEKQFFDDNFGPFYRTQQAFLVNDTTEAGPSPVLSYETLAWWFDVEQQIRRLKSYEYGVTLEDVCLNPTGEACVVQSVTSYFHDDFWEVKRESWREQIRTCAENPGQCLPDFGQPIKKELVFGGYQASGDVADSAALMTTWVLVNHAEGSPETKKSEDWERSLKNTLLAVKQEAKEMGLRLSFSTEISLEEELNKSTNTDAKIVVISYIAMFFYASIALGSTTLAVKNMLRYPGKTLVNSKFTLGVFGIIIVLMSVSASVGLFSAMGIKVTLIIAEVIPFLVLAVGVDNIFLIVHEFERIGNEHPDDELEVQIGRAMGRMGPSILLSATSETLAFGLGAIVTMPAVRNFAVYAAGAVFINAVLQVTMFVSVLALNKKRMDANRIDCFPCLPAPKDYQTTGYNGNSADDHEGGLIGELRREGHGSATGFDEVEEGFIQRTIRKHYAPRLLKKHTKLSVLTIFFGIFAASLALLPKMELGLDQRIAIPTGSYLINYFDDLYDYFGVGPPVYFVTRDFNATTRAAQQELCGRFSTCDPLSLSNIIEQERKRPEISYISEPAASWIDDFFLWLNPSLDQCCRVKKSNSEELCGPYDPDVQCRVCFQDRNPSWNITLNGMPEGKEFMDYLKIWIDAPTGESCPLAGKAGYSTALVPDYEHNSILASHFRASHTPLKSQSDFIAAYAAARRIAKEVSKTAKTEVFPYSKFYIFFDQYVTIVRMTALLLSAALGAVFLVCSVLLGSIKTGAVVAGTVAMIVVDIMGIMTIWGVSLNAVSLVNLVICVGIGVEFCAHIARGFMVPAGSVMERAKVGFRGKDARAWAGLVGVGGSVFSGITLTKLIGVTVLAWTRSKIFEVYYFRIWLALVVVAALHSLVFLPVALSFWGGEGWVESEDGGLETNLARRRRGGRVMSLQMGEEEEVEEYDSDESE
ncbi:sterol-sensing domain of SREBP cleavage-activation-domain-containing protein [Pyronema domesticum]|uniref:Similar to Niemann-Pick type C-related protein 1 acc. no. Q12200 n=1 Tax=Pyronema omphalodes (strain CBS 100304) TaxID=1076935 RepID=U4L2H4_PYROM|nr:sterol-sensing domain of SREBP cleavage-activation-domain-containing protein [Pyronema domesticum]CCX10094.1 Similar to Niemann-Pick type C-related protein 1; acc. no. Q12200 [Pyronema omphalodes CBS 100304]